MESTYYPPLPSSLQVDDSIKQFIATFYKTSDDGQKNEEWIAFFRDDAEFILGSISARGTDELRKVRQGMWKDVGERRHTVLQAFPGRFSAETDRLDIMMVGTVDYKSKTGEQRDGSWAGHMKLREDADGKLRIAYYRVYLQQ